MQCVCLEHNFHQNRTNSDQPGIGVTTSGGEYLRDTGKMLVFLEAESNDDVNVSTPRPLLVVASGKTTMTRLGFSETRRERGITCVVGVDEEKPKQDANARSSDIGRTLRVSG